MINVTGTGSNPIHVSATEYVGLAPMTINLDVSDATGAIQTISADPGGNGTLGNLTVSSTSASIPLTYLTPGTMVDPSVKTLMHRD